MTTKTVLLPCPFCGDKGEISHSRDFERVNVLCVNYGNGCQGAGAISLSEESAVHNWNTRLVPPARAVPSRDIDNAFVHWLETEPGVSCANMETLHGYQPHLIGRLDEAFFAGADFVRKLTPPAEPARAARDETQLENIRRAISGVLAREKMTLRARAALTDAANELRALIAAAPAESQR